MTTKPAPSVSGGNWSRLSLVLALLVQLTATRPILAANASDESAAAGDGSPATADRIVKMSQFEVTTTQGTGYVASNSAHGFKTNQDLIEIPQASIVVTSDMIRDTGYYHSSDVLRFVGVVSQYQGEAFSVRGSRAAAYFIDDMPDYTQGYEDDIGLDSYDVLKGPAAVLYPNAGLTGAILKSTKKPLGREQGSFVEMVDQYGLNRTTFDYNRPIGKIGETQFDFRLVGAYQKGKFYFQNKVDDRFVIHPMVGIHYGKATVYVSYDYEKFNITENEQSILTPSGQLWTGWGRNIDGLPAGGDPVNNTHILGRIEYLQAISSDWENRFQALGGTLRFYGSTVLSAGSLNFANLTETFHPVLYNLPIEEWVVMDDVTGREKFGPFPAQSTFGFTTVDRTGLSEAWLTAPFGTNGVLTVPINSPTAIGSVIVPPVSAYTVPANPGTRSKQLFDNIYWQQELDVIPGRLALVAGFTFANIETITDTNLAANAPYSATDQTDSHFLHRFGAILHLTKDVVLYVLNSTTFSPGVGVDYNNNRISPVRGQGTEVGMKTALWDGKLSSTISVYHMALTNQAIIGPGTNVAGVGFYNLIGSTTQKGVDGDLAFSLVPGWQMILTGYVGSVTNQTGTRAISGTYDNSWSLFTRYDFDRTAPWLKGALKGFAVGGGVARIGSYWLSTSAIVQPPGPQYPNPIKLHEGLPVNAFVEARFAKHWLGRVNVVNLLGQVYPMSGQAPYTINPSPVRTFSFSLEYRF